MSSVRNPSRTWTRWSQTLATEASPRERENSAMGDSLDSAMIFVHVILAMKFGRWSALGVRAHVHGVPHPPRVCCFLASHH